MDTFSITNATRGPAPRVAFSAIKERVLGKRYALSLVFVGKARMRRLNASYRDVDAPTDILSFPLSKNSGEIVIHIDSAKKKARAFGYSGTEYLVFVFIHGLLHLKGYSHGRTMEKLEDLWCSRFGIPPPLRTVSFPPHHGTQNRSRD